MVHAKQTNPGEYLIYQLLETHTDDGKRHMWITWGLVTANTPQEARDQDEYGIDNKHLLVTF